jgi:thiaminase
MTTDLIEKNIVKQSPNRVEELIQIFIRATELEIEFWEMGLHQR